MSFLFWSLVFALDKAGNEYTSYMYVYVCVASSFLNQIGHVMRAEFRCSKTPLHIRTWASSTVFGGHYLVNQKYILGYRSSIIHVTIMANILLCRLVHSFTSAGMIPTQYIKFGEISGLGHVSKSYIQDGM